MSRYPAFADENEQQPITWLHGHAIYAAHFIVVVYVASMLITSVMMALGLGEWLAWLPFTSGEVMRGQVWRIATYGLENPPSLQFVFDMFMIGWFGRELE